MKIKHKDNELAVSLNQENEDPNIQEIKQKAIEFRQQFKMHSLFKPSKARFMEVFLLSEKGCDPNLEQELQENKMKSVTRVEIEYGEFINENEVGFIFPHPLN